MAKLSKSQKQLVLLGLVLATIVVVLAIFFVKPTEIIRKVYVPPTVDTAISKRLLLIPEYKKLTTPVQLPLVPGRAGRPNPFLPY